MGGPESQPHGNGGVRRERPGGSALCAVWGWGGYFGGTPPLAPRRGLFPQCCGVQWGDASPHPGLRGAGVSIPLGAGGGGHGADAGCPQGPAPRPVPHVSPCSPPPSPLPHPAPALPWGPAGPPPAPRGPPCPTVLFLPPLGCWGSLQPPNLHPGPGLWQAAVAGRLGGDLAGITKPSDKTLGRERRD